MFIRLVDQIINLSTILLCFLLPLFFLPFTADFYDFNKQALLLAVTSITLLAWIGKFILQKTVRLTLTPLTLPLFLLTAAFTASAILQSPNQVEAFLGRPSSLIALLLLTLTLNSNLTLTSLRRSVYALTASATILSLVAIYQALGLAKFDFTPAGSPLALTTFLVPTLAISLYFALTKPSLNRLIWFLVSGTILAGLVVTVYQILPGKPASPILLPYSVSWAIAINQFKSLREGLLGTGPENFIQAFSVSRPTQLNLTSLWNLRFNAASNEPLHLLTTTGLIGLASWIWLILSLIRHRLTSSVASDHQHLSYNLLIALGISFLVQLLIPANYLLLTTFYLLLILWSTLLKLTDHPRTHDVVLKLFAAQVIRPNTSFAQVQQTIHNTEILPWILGVPLTLGILVLWYFGFNHVYAAEMIFKQSLEALRQNRGTDTYNLQIQAIQKNRFLPRYHRAYATTNLALANSLSQTETELSTQDRQNITQLVQQAIREAKVAVQLNPKDPANWETLATVYRNLINVAQGADQWAIATAAQAAQSDPSSPRLRLELGGIYYATGRYDEAIRAFQQATELKPDWANAYYNLAAAYKEKGDWRQAVRDLDTVLRLVDPASADYQKVQTELAALQQKLGETPPAGGPAPAQTNLNPPSPSPTPNPALGNITLPESASPGALPSR